VKDQHGSRNKPKVQLPLPIIVCFILLLGSLQVLGEGETWIGRGNFPIKKKHKTFTRNLKYSFKFRKVKFD
jgi:hypothetical protein